GLAIEIAVEIEQEHFEQDGAYVEHRPAAEIRNAVVASFANPDAHGINSVAEAAGRIEPQVCGRIAEGAAALVAMHRLAAHEPWVSEKSARLPDAAGRQSLADRSRGDRAAALAQDRHDIDRKAVFRALGGKEFRRAGAPLAEMKVVADRGPRDRKPPHQRPF